MKITNQELKETIQFFKIEGIAEYGSGDMKVALSRLLNLAERYLVVSEIMPQKPESDCQCGQGDSCGCSVDDYNKGVKDCVILLTKKLSMLGEIINDSIIRNLRENQLSNLVAEDVVLYLLQEQKGDNNGKSKI